MHTASSVAGPAATGGYTSSSGWTTASRDGTASSVGRACAARICAGRLRRMRSVRAGGRRRRDAVVGAGPPGVARRAMVGAGQDHQPRVVSVVEVADQPAQLGALDAGRSQSTSALRRVVLEEEFERLGPSPDVVTSTGSSTPPAGRRPVPLGLRAPCAMRSLTMLPSPAPSPGGEVTCSPLRVVHRPGGLGIGRSSMRALEDAVATAGNGRGWRQTAKQRRTTARPVIIAPCRRASRTHSIGGARPPGLVVCLWSSVRGDGPARLPG